MFSGRWSLNCEKVHKGQDGCATRGTIDESVLQKQK